MQLLLSSDIAEGVICRDEVSRLSGNVADASAFIVVTSPERAKTEGTIALAAPALGTGLHGSYTAGSALVASQRYTYGNVERGPSSLGALAGLPGFSTNALMLRKAAERRREQQCSE